MLTLKIACFSGIYYDELLLRKNLKTPISTPTESMYMEFGNLRVGTMIKARRINFLHYIVNRK